MRLSCLLWAGNTRQVAIIHISTEEGLLVQIWVLRRLPNLSVGLSVLKGENGSSTVNLQWSHSCGNVVLADMWNGRGLKEGLSSPATETLSSWRQALGTAWPLDEHLGLDQTPTIRGEGQALKRHHGGRGMVWRCKRASGIWAFRVSMKMDEGWDHKSHWGGREQPGKMGQKTLVARVQGVLFSSVVVLIKEFALITCTQWAMWRKKEQRGKTIRMSC